MARTNGSVAEGGSGEPVGPGADSEGSGPKVRGVSLPFEQLSAYWLRGSNLEIVRTTRNLLVRIISLLK